MAACEQLADKPQAHEIAVCSLLDNDCTLVVAYALHTLRLMGSAQLASLPPTLLERHDKFKQDIGSFRFASELAFMPENCEHSLSTMRPNRSLVRTRLNGASHSSGSFDDNAPVP
jgi:hypothetical protein